MTEKNYKVAIIEQVESTRSCLERNLQKSNLNSEKLMGLSLEEKLELKSGLVSKREISQIFSKGTFNNTNKDTYEAQYVLAIS